MDQVDAVVEQVAELRGGQRHPRQLAVHGVEERHDPGADQARPELPLPKEPEGGEHQQQTDVGHMVGAQPGGGAPAGDDPRRDRPNVLSDQVGHALVRALEGARFDRAGIGGVELYQDRRLALAELAVVGQFGQVQPLQAGRDRPAFQVGRNRRGAARLGMRGHRDAIIGHQHGARPLGQCRDHALIEYPVGQREHHGAARGRRVARLQADAGEDARQPFARRHRPDPSRTRAQSHAEGRGHGVNRGLHNCEAPFPKPSGALIAAPARRVSAALQHGGRLRHRRL